MSSKSKKHILDSLLREIYGKKSPPDLTDQIMNRVESGETELRSESRATLDQKPVEPRPNPVEPRPAPTEPTVEPASRREGRSSPAGTSFLGTSFLATKRPWMIAASLVVGAAMITALIQYWPGGGKSDGTTDVASDSQEQNKSGDSTGKDEKRNLLPNHQIVETNQKGSLMESELRLTERILGSRIIRAHNLVLPKMAMILKTAGSPIRVTPKSWRDPFAPGQAGRQNGSRKNGGSRRRGTEQTMARQRDRHPTDRFRGCLAATRFQQIARTGSGAHRVTTIPFVYFGKRE